MYYSIDDVFNSYSHKFRCVAGGDSQYKTFGDAMKAFLKETLDTLDDESAESWLFNQATLNDKQSAEYFLVTGLCCLSLILDTLIYKILNMYSSPVLNITSVSDEYIEFNIVDKAETYLIFSLQNVGDNLNIAADCAFKADDLIGAMKDFAKYNKLNFRISQNGKQTARMTYKNILLDTKEIIEAAMNGNFDWTLYASAPGI